MRMWILMAVLSVGFMAPALVGQQQEDRPLAEQGPAVDERPIGEEGQTEPSFSLTTTQTALVGLAILLAVGVMVLIGVIRRNREAEEVRREPKPDRPGPPKA